MKKNNLELSGPADLMYLVVINSETVPILLEILIYT